jgi:hypothetical protein
VQVKACDTEGSRDNQNYVVCHPGILARKIPPR